jgi:hypothetical protein
MEFTEQNCQLVIDTFEENEREGMKRVDNLLSMYLTKYKIKDKEMIEKYFRKDTKQIFQVIQKTMANEELLKGLEDEFDENDERDMKDKIEYLNFVSNIDYVLQLIDTVDLQNPDAEYTYSCNSAIEFLNQKKTDMDSLNETMNKLGNTLDNLTNTQYNVVEQKLKSD